MRMCYDPSPMVVQKFWITEPPMKGLKKQAVLDMRRHVSIYCWVKTTVKRSLRSGLLARSIRSAVLYAPSFCLRDPPPNQTQKLTYQLAYAKVIRFHGIPPSGSLQFHPRVGFMLSKPNQFPLVEGYRLSQDHQIS